MDTEVSEVSTGLVVPGQGTEAPNMLEQMQKLLAASMAQIGSQIAQVNGTVTQQIAQVNSTVAQQIKSVTQEMTYMNENTIRLEKRMGTLTTAMANQVADLSRQIDTVYAGMDDINARQWETEDALSSIRTDANNDSRDERLEMLVSKYPLSDIDGLSDPTWRLFPGVAKNATVPPLDPPSSRERAGLQVDEGASADNAPVRRSARLLAKQSDRGLAKAGAPQTRLTIQEEVGI